MGRARSGLDPATWGTLPTLFLGAAFTLGLVLVVIAGSDLATGNMMLVPLGALRGKIRAPLTPLVRGGATLEQPIDAEDVTAAIENALAEETTDDVVLDLAGPESLTHRELVCRAAELIGRKPRFLPVPLTAATLFAWLAARFGDDPLLTPAMLGVLDRDDRIDPSPCCERLGLALTPLDETLRRCLREEGNSS